MQLVITSLGFKFLLLRPYSYVIFTRAGSNTRKINNDVLKFQNIYPRTPFVAFFIDDDSDLCVDSNLGDLTVTQRTPIVS